MDEYLARHNISPHFDTQHPMDEQGYNYQLIANLQKYNDMDIV